MERDPGWWFHSGGGSGNARLRGEQRWRLAFLLGAFLLVAAVVGRGLQDAQPAAASGQPFRTGDIFVSGWGSVFHINPDFGQIDQTEVVESGSANGMAFDSDGNLYVATGVSVVKISPEGIFLGELFEAEGAQALTIDGDGNIFIPGESGLITEYDSGGDYVDDFTVSLSGGYSYISSIAIAGDGCTLFYSNANTVIKRYDVCEDEQMADFGSGLTSPTAIQLAPDDGLLVSDTDVIHLFNSSGVETDTYGTPESGVVWRSMGVEPGGLTFLAYNQDVEGTIYRFEFDGGEQTEAASYATGGESNLANDMVVYGGDNASPDPTPSLYVKSLDNETWYSDSKPYKWGCAVRRDHPMGPVILFFGQAWFDESSYGTRLTDEDATYVTTSEIEIAVHRFLLGYSDSSCISNYVQVPFLYLVLATSNYFSGTGTNHVTYDHGQAWASLVDDVSTWIGEESMGGMAEVWGGIDAEVSWNFPVDTESWTNGYADIEGPPYVNVGDAAGCPTTDTTETAAECVPSDSALYSPEDCEATPYPCWLQSDLFYISWGQVAAYPFPQIYREDGSQAEQWQQISLYGVLNSYGRMGFKGALTQHQACADNAGTDDACAPGIDNCPDAGFQQLWEALNASNDTGPVYFSWSSDVTATGWNSPPATTPPPTCPA